MDNKNKEEKSPQIIRTDGAPFEVTVEGSLGLLALGFHGLVAWRQKRREDNYNFGQHLYNPNLDKNNVK